MLHNNLRLSVLLANNRLKENFGTYNIDNKDNVSVELTMQIPSIEDLELSSNVIYGFKRVESSKNRYTSFLRPKLQ